MLCAILYLENSDKARFSDLKKRVENDYVLNKAEYPRTVTSVQSLVLNYQLNYKSNRNSQSNGVNNQLIFAQREKNGDNEGNRKEKEQIPRRNMDHITCNDCGYKVHYSVNSDGPTQTKLKEDAKAFIKIRQKKYTNKPPSGGKQKALMNEKDATCSLMIGSPTKKWGKPPPHSLML